MLEAATAGVISGAALLGAAGVRAALGVRGLWRREEHAAETTERRRASFANQLEAALHWARASRPALRAWTGTRPFRVSAVVDESEGCRSFYLIPEDGRPLPRFEPGQYLTFHLPTTDPMRPLVRCYSLSERPREDFYRVTVKRVSPSTERKSSRGSGSDYFHREVRPGSLLMVEAPQGAFFLDPTDDLPVVLVGGGIGVTPLVSMAAALVHRRDARPVYLVTGFRNSREHPFRLRLAELTSSLPSGRIDVSYSRPLVSDQQGEHYDHRGHVDVARLRRVLPSSNFRFYICGPAAMMQSLVPGLLNWGVPPEHIHYEAFGPASVQRLAERASTAPCEVQFARSERSLRWTGAESSLLELAEQGGVRLDAGCRAGSCGQCRVIISAGRAIHAKPPGVQLVEGECLACIARPEGHLVVDA
jgi:ferredoxin-NADP reductase